MKYNEKQWKIGILSVLNKDPDKGWTEEQLFDAEQDWLEKNVS